MVILVLLVTLGIRHRDQPDDPQGLAVTAEARQEIAVYRQYSDDYGYAFIVMKCPEEPQ